MSNVDSIEPSTDMSSTQDTLGNITDRLIPMGGGKPHPDIINDRKAYVVEFDGPSDPWNAMNWPSSKRFWISVIVCYDTFVATFNSACFAPGSAQAGQDFGVSEEVGKLGTSLYVLGFALGPLIWAPGSELIGRRWPLLLGVFGMSVFTIASATCKDIQTLIITRFLAGVFGASPLCVVPGVLADIYNNIHRGTAISIYALSVFVGPFGAPFIGGFITTSYLRWRWTLYLPAIMGFLDFALLVFFLNETYPPLILVEKAAQIRRETGNWSVHAEHEKLEFDMQEVTRKYLTRPVRMLVTEPLVLLVTIYMSFVYGLVYGILEAYPYVFGHVYGMSPGVGALPFMALVLGLALAVLFVILHQRSYLKKAANGRREMVPEFRLFPPTIGAFVFTAGLFWFSWTGFTSSIHWMAPTAAGLFIGFGLLSIFLPCFNYLVDAYLPLAASTVAANILLRSSVAAAFPLFATQMFENLGVQWAGTLLACLAAVMIPIPFVFRRYGASIRARSKLLSEYGEGGQNKGKGGEGEG